MTIRFMFILMMLFIRVNCKKTSKKDKELKPILTELNTKEIINKDIKNIYIYIYFNFNLCKLRKIFWSNHSKYEGDLIHYNIYGKGIYK